MRKIITGLLVICFQFNFAQEMKIRYELTNGKETSTYDEVIDFGKTGSEIEQNQIV